MTPDLDKLVTVALFLLGSGLVACIVLTAVEVLWPAPPK